MSGFCVWWLVVVLGFLYVCYLGMVHVYFVFGCSVLVVSACTVSLYGACHVIAALQQCFRLCCILSVVYICAFKLLNMYLCFEAVLRTAMYSVHLCCFSRTYVMSQCFGLRLSFRDVYSCESLD